VDGDAPQTIRSEMLRREARLAEINAELGEVQQKHPNADEAEIRKTCGGLIGRFKGLLLGEGPWQDRRCGGSWTDAFAGFPGHSGWSENLAL